MAKPRTPRTESAELARSASWLPPRERAVADIVVAPKVQRRWRGVASGKIRIFLQKLYLPENKLNIDSVAELDQTNQGGNYGL